MLIVKQDTIWQIECFSLPFTAEGFSFFPDFIKKWSETSSVKLEDFYEKICSNVVSLENITCSLIAVETARHLCVMYEPLPPAYSDQYLLTCLYSHSISYINYDYNQIIIIIRQLVCTPHNLAVTVNTLKSLLKYWRSGKYVSFKF